MIYTDYNGEVKEYRMEQYLKYYYIHRFFTLDSGVLTYAKNEADIRRGRTQGRINVGTSIISAKTEMYRIDIDDEECIHHLKVSLA